MDTNLFPIGVQKHTIFVIIGVIFFILQFARTRRWYQPVMAAAIAASLLIYIDTSNETLFYGVGIAEGVMLFTALTLSIVQAVLNRRAEKAAEAKEKAEHPESPDTPDTPAAPTEA
jgi:hypothetical protein